MSKKRSTSAAKSSSVKRYSEEFKREAVRLVSVEKYSFNAASAATGVSENSLREWHARLVPPPASCGEEASLQELREENKRLRQQLRRAELERENLKKSHGVFAKESL